MDDTLGRKIPASTEIKIVDFGNATWGHEYHASIINTRQYRAPEVILDLGWDSTSDLWSLGAILLELVSGELFFPTHSDYQHLAMIEVAFGRIPSWMVRYCSRDLKKYFNKDQNLNWPKWCKTRSEVRDVDSFSTVDDLIKSSELKDLCYNLMEISPSRRMKAAEALESDFIKNSNQ